MTQYTPNIDVGKLATQCLTLAKESGVPENEVLYFLVCLAQCRTTDVITPLFNLLYKEKPYEESWLQCCMQAARAAGLVSDATNEMAPEIRGRLFDVLMDKSGDGMRNKMLQTEQHLICLNAQNFMEGESACSASGKVAYLAILALRGNDEQCERYEIFPTVTDSPTALYAQAKKHGIPPENHSPVRQQFASANTHNIELNAAQQKSLETYLNATYPRIMPRLRRKIMEHREDFSPQSLESEDALDTTTPAYTARTDEASSYRKDLLRSWTNRDASGYRNPNNIITTLRSMKAKNIEVDPQDVIRAATYNADDPELIRRSPVRKGLIKLTLDVCPTFTKHTRDAISRILDDETRKYPDRKADNASILEEMDRKLQNLSGLTR